MTVRNLNGLGTPETVWDKVGLPDTLPEVLLDSLVPDGARVVLVSPHPDDEVLGAGGILAALALREVPVTVVAVTDGERSHPGRTEELRSRRALERSKALAVLGSEASVVRLSQPDGGIDEELLRRQLSDIVEEGDVVLAPWPEDGHPDHDSCGRAARGLGSRCLSYLVWAWHWASPPEIPWESAVRVLMTPEQLVTKRRAVQAYQSQVEGDDPILPKHVRIRLLHSSEVLLR